MYREKARTPRLMTPGVTTLKDVSPSALVPPPRVPTQSEVIALAEVIALPNMTLSEMTMRPTMIEPADVIDLAAADQWLADRSRRREQLLHELETARARRRRRGGLRSV